MTDESDFLHGIRRSLLMMILMLSEGMLFAVAVGVIIGIAVGFIFLLTFCVCKHRSLRPPPISWLIVLCIFPRPPNRLA